MSREAVANVLAEIEEIHPEVVDVEDAAEVAVDDGLTQHEITEEVVAVDTELQEVRRMEDTALALEDMTIVEDHIAEASPTDLLLIETATRLAAAGSDVEVEEVIPGLESYAGKKPSMEGIRQLASTIWNAIVNFCRKIWSRVVHFFNLMITSLFGVKRAITKQKEKIAALKAAGAKIKDDQKKITLGREGVYIARGEKGPKDMLDVLSGAKAFGEAVEWLTGGYTKGVIGAYSSVGTALAAFNADDMQKSLGKVVVAVATSSIGEYPRSYGSEKVTHPSYSDKTYKQSKPLPGNYVFIAAKNSGMVSSSNLEKQPSVVADEVSHCTVVLKKLHVEVDTAGEFVTADLNSLEKLNVLCDAIITHAKVYAETGKTAMEAARRNMEKATDALVSKTKDSDAKPGDATMLKAAIRFNVMLTEAASQPITAGIAAANTLVRNYIILTRRNMAAYA